MKRLEIDRIALITDAWHPQINGVVRTLDTVSQHLRAAGYTVDIISPERFRTLPCPFYQEIRLSINAWPKVNRLLNELSPNAIHIATEGPLGWAARAYCMKHATPFSTSFHTRFAEMFERWFGLPRDWGYTPLRRFHNAAAATLVPTASMQTELEQRGFTGLNTWSRGVDTTLFHPDKRIDLPYPRPIQLYVGRVSKEKNIEAFLEAGLLGTKLIVGNGPERATLEARYPDAVFLGVKHGEELAQLYASSDVFVFPSKRDTYGIVMLEALASGTPVAAFPVPGPIDVLTDSNAATMGDDLSHAIQHALTLSRTDVRSRGEQFSWVTTAAQLANTLQPRSK